MPLRKANSQWNGTLTEGNGSMAFGSGAFEGQFSFSSRFEEGTGTNPEELIAAAHSGCFSMQLSGLLGQAGYPPESVRTEGRVRIEKAGEGFAISRIDLVTVARVPGIDEGTFQETVRAAKETCPVSVALGAVPEINAEASLEG